MAATASPHLLMREVRAMSRSFGISGISGRAPPLNDSASVRISSLDAVLPVSVISLPTATASLAIPTGPLRSAIVATKPAINGAAATFFHSSAVKSFRVAIQEHSSCRPARARLGPVRQDASHRKVTPFSWRMPTGFRGYESQGVRVWQGEDVQFRANEHKGQQRH